MGTNYYAEWSPGGPVTISLHLCKSYSTFSGLMFPTWRDWRRWLEHHSDDTTADVTVRNEYGDTFDMEGFIANVEGALNVERNRERFQEWQRDRFFDPTRDYLDPDGYLFHRGEFF